MAATTTNANKANNEQATANTAANKANVEQAKAKAAAERAKATAENQANDEQATANAAANKANVEQAKAKAAAERAKATPVDAKMAGETNDQVKDAATKAAQGAAKMAQEANSAMVESSKAGSRALVDNYAKVAKGLLQMQRQLVGTARIQWVQDAATTQIQFAEDVTDAWTKAARNLLK